jgi:FMN phosphatase YigB (HAD superfamily)
MDHVQAIIFDVGGTLLEGAMPWHELYMQALRLARHEVRAEIMLRNYEEAIARMVVARRQAIAEMDGRRLLHELFAECLGLSYRRLQQAIDEVIFDNPQARHLVRVEGVREVLAELKKRGYRLAVISNWTADLPTTLGQLGLKDYFEGIFASETMGIAKPEAAAFLVPVEKLGLTPGVTAYVGDVYPIDILGSREVGMTPVWIDHMRLNLHRDVATVDHVVRLLEVFRGVRSAECPRAQQPR